MLESLHAMETRIKILQSENVKSLPRLATSPVEPDIEDWRCCDEKEEPPTCRVSARKRSTVTLVATFFVMKRQPMDCVRDI